MTTERLGVDQEGSTASTTDEGEGSTRPGDPRWLERLIDFAEQSEDRLAELSLRLPHGDFDDDDVVMVDDARFAITQLIAALAPVRTARITFGLPPDESPARNTVVELLTAELLVVGETAYHAGEATTFDLRDEKAIRGIMRYLTARDSGGRDGVFGERKRVFWEHLGRALSPTPLPATDLLAGAPVPAVDPSRSTPNAV